MAQLDRLLTRLESGAASLILLEADAPIQCVTPAGLQQVSTQVLTAAQVMALVRELATPEDEPAIAAGTGIRFLYAFNNRKWLVQQQEDDPSTLRFRVRQWVDRPTAATDEPRIAVRRREDDAPSGAFATPDQAQDALDKLLRIQVSRGAADLHLRVGEPPIYRLGGDVMRVEGEPPLAAHQVDTMLKAIMPERNRREFEERRDTDFAYEIEGLSRFRVNVLRDQRGTAAVLRTVATGTVTVEDMGISPEVQALCHLTKGLVLVTGPTGSGKSTTLSAMVDLMNRTRSDHIITIEDPIEFVHQSRKCLITQREVGVHTDSFKSALRAALREDPDVILVGELRDLETIAIALETAETGHLVLGTLHTSTAAGTVSRIVDQFPADRQDQIRIMLAESLKGVVSQTLCRKIGGGRVAAREVLIVNKAVSALIRENKAVQINNVIQTQRKLGMETLNDALLQLVKSRQVEPSEAYLRSVERKDMLLKLKTAGFHVPGVQADD